MSADARLKAYYIASPSAPKNRCPTWVFTTAAARAFAGTGELEDGTIVIEDIICILSSLIDQVNLLNMLSTVELTGPEPDRRAHLVLAAASCNEAQGRWDGRVSAVEGCGATGCTACCIAWGKGARERGGERGGARRSEESKRRERGERKERS